VAGEDLADGGGDRRLRVVAHLVGDAAERGARTGGAGEDQGAEISGEVYVGYSGSIYRCRFIF
jgi:hypothetical protein